jgi:hypothetical protein
MAVIGQGRFWPLVSPIPKFARDLDIKLWANFGIGDTSKLLILVSFGFESSP